jgi:hypothetical protein
VASVTLKTLNNATKRAGSWTVGRTRARRTKRRARAEKQRRDEAAQTATGTHVRHATIRPVQVLHRLLSP